MTCPIGSDSCLPLVMGDLLPPSYGRFVAFLSEIFFNFDKRFLQLVDDVMLALNKLLVCCIPYAGPFQRRSLYSVMTDELSMSFAVLLHSNNFDFSIILTLTQHF